MKSINILHISDAHIQSKDKKQIKEIVEKLINDVLKVQREKNINIDLVCFTGDLIQRGDNAITGENQLNIAQEILIKPILERLELSNERFIMAPGNHEVDTSRIITATEKGLIVNSLDEINLNIKEMNETYLYRLKYFYNWIKSFNKETHINEIGYSYKIDIGDSQIGLVCLDSAWRSSGKGECERGQLYVGKKQVEDLYNEIKDTNIRICLMHHPVNWLSGYELSVIEQELAKFDIVLHGHVHENNHKAVLFQNIRTIFSTAGKLYPLDYVKGQALDGYNGYTILSIDLLENTCNLYLRSYFAKDRNDFDCAINLIENGEVSYILDGDSDEKHLEYLVLSGIREYLTNMSDTLSIIKEIDVLSPQSIEQIFVDPILSEESEYKIESSGKGKSIALDEVLSNNDNTILLGKKESGKTTVLQQIGIKYIEQYSIKGIIPIYIDMRQLSKKSDRLSTATISFIVNNFPNDKNIKKEKIHEILKNGKCVFLIDNVSVADADEILILSKFIANNNKNRFILTIIEEFFQSIDVKKLPEYAKNFKKIYINSFGKAQIRELVTKWADKREDVEDVSKIVDKIDDYCNMIRFAKTPFNISIFMVLWDADKNFIPQNEGIVMENYLEIVLEKMSPKEADRSTYSFKIKQHFLSNLAYKMFQNNKYNLSQEDFEEYVLSYHKQKGYRENESRFSTLFIEKNILSISDGMIVFSHTSFLEFYLAEYARNNTDFYNFMTQKKNRIHFQNEICFYSGLVPDCKLLLDNLSDTILETIINNIDAVDDLNNLEIMADFKMRLAKDDLLKRLEENRPSQKEIDIMSDNTFSKEEVTPEDFEKKKNSLWSGTKDEQVAENTEDFYTLVSIYGSIIKNAELLDNKDKIQHLENYMYAMNIILGEILRISEKAKNEMTYEGFLEEKKDSNQEVTYEDFEEAKRVGIDMLKVACPIALQHLILENVGTPKLEIAINELMHQRENKPFEKFMLMFLKCDQKLKNSFSELHKYIENETSKSILKLVYIKLIFYYRMRFFGTDKKVYDDILDLIIELNIKVTTNNDHKMVKAFKGNRDLARKKIAKQIDQVGGLGI